MEGINLGVIGNLFRVKNLEQGGGLGNKMWCPFLKISKGAKGSGLGQGAKDALTLCLTFTIAISFVCKCQTNFLKLNFNETPNFDGKLQLFWQNMHHFQKERKIDNMLCMMLDFCYKGSKLVI